MVQSSQRHIAGLLLPEYVDSAFDDAKLIGALNSIAIMAEREREDSTTAALQISEPAERQPVLGAQTNIGKTTARRDGVNVSRDSCRQHGLDSLQAGAGYPRHGEQSMKVGASFL